MFNDSKRILDFLVVQGDMWSRQSRLSQYRHIVLDADSIVTSLFRRSVSNHIERLRASNQPVDLYAATLINYKEFSRDVSLLLDFLKDHNVEPIVVYEGKFMEAPLYGSLSAEFTKYTEQVVERVAMNELYDKRDTFPDPVNHLSRPNLALNVFKSIVKERRQAGASIRVEQAFYSAGPSMAKLARDLKCPVLTNNGEFIIMDVRAGFMLFKDFWRQVVEGRAPRSKSRSTSRSPKSSLSSRSPKSSLSSRSLKSRSAKSAPRSAPTSTDGPSCKFYFNNLFLFQHPGLNPSLALNLFALTSVDFVTHYSGSLMKRLHVYDREYTKQDFALEGDPGPKQAYLRHHKAASRFEMAMRFLTNKTFDIVANLIRSEGERSKTGLNDDYRQLFNYYAVAYGFKLRLKSALKYVYDPNQLSYIDKCLRERECTAEWLLVLLCCSIGRLSAVGYNRHIQFEDLATKRSAYSSSNEIKSMFMSLFSENKSHKSEHSTSLSKGQRDAVASKYPTASLTAIDRERSKVVEQIVPTTCENPKLDQLRERLQLNQLAAHKIDKQDSTRFINLVFKCENLLQLPADLRQTAEKHVTEGHVRNELAIVLSLFQFSAKSLSSGDDKYAKEAYSKLLKHFELAILNHYLHANHLLSKASGVGSLVTLINKQDFENVCATGSAASSASKQKSLKRSKTSPKSQSEPKSMSRASGEISRRIRHLIELLNASMEAYCELNAFFDYPLPRLRLHLSYNPILLYNLTLYSINNPSNKTMLGHK